MQTNTQTTINLAVEQSNAAHSPDATPTIETRPDAKAARAENLRINGDKPKIDLPGNTFPIKGLLYVLGSTWDKERKVQTVPEHTLKQAQEALAHVTKLIEEKRAASAARKAEKELAKMSREEEERAGVLIRKAEQKAEAKFAGKVSPLVRTSRKSPSQIVAERRANLIAAQKAREAAKA